MNKNEFAKTPPMGWNSYDYYDTTVNEEQVRANADYMAAHLKEYGWEYVVIDIQWYANDAGTKRDRFQYIPFGDQEMDEFGRLQPSPARFPSSAGGKGFGPLADYVHSLGLKFGIWVEPEMVSEDSDLYREHPDWALKVPGREPVRGRNQLVLDFSREDVREFIFDRICSVLEQGNIEYLKWDMNRSLADVYSARSVQGKVTYDYMVGLYDFLEKLTAKYPDLLIEGCSGGGGRFDAGMLYYTPQIWCSDNTDAVDRLRIQYGTSFLYPISAVGSHVSAVPNHQTGRMTSLHTRGVVAMAGTFGYELDPGKLTDREKEEVKEQVARFKGYADLVREGDYYRLSDPFRDSCGAWMFVSRDGAKALVNVVMLEVHGNMPVTYVRLKGLKPEAVYEDAESRRRYSGAALMNAGLPMPLRMGEYPAYQMELNEVQLS